MSQIRRHVTPGVTLHVTPSVQTEGEMDDAREPQSEHSSPYLRLPWPAVVAILVGTLALILAAGIYANRNLRPQADVVATPPAAVAVIPTTTVAPTATPLPVMTPTPLPMVVAAIAVSTATSPIPTGVPTPTASSQAGLTPSPSPTLDPILVAEVSNAYDRYWEVRSQALLELDKSHLAEVMGGDHLDSMTQLIEQLTGEGRAIKTDVDHDFNVVQVGADSAQIVDDYISNSVYVEAITLRALTQPARDELRVLYRLSKSDGAWKVVDSVRAD